MSCSTPYQAHLKNKCLLVSKGNFTSSPHSTNYTNRRSECGVGNIANSRDYTNEKIQRNLMPSHHANEHDVNMFMQKHPSTKCIYRFKRYFLVNVNNYILLAIPIAVSFMLLLAEFESYMKMQYPFDSACE